MDFAVLALTSSVATPALIGGFTVFVLVMLAIDLFVFHREAHQVGTREALAWSAVWISLALAFNAGIYFYFGPETGPKLAIEFFTGYVIEKALSVDNLFVFLIIFAYFRVPSELQHRVLFWGILGALIMRAIFILAGAMLIAKFHWILLVFGAFLVFTGIKMLFSGDDELDPGQNPVLRFFKKHVPSVTEYRGAKFFVNENGRKLATPLLFVLISIEATDLVFAVDSIPAVFAVSSDPFIIYTSNIFAILGLRALFFLLHGMMGKFHYLKIGLAAVLIFIGGKMLADNHYKELVKKIFGAEHLSGVKVSIDVVVSLVVIAVLLGVSMLVSLLKPAPEPVLEAAIAAEKPAAPLDEKK